MEIISLKNFQPFSSVPKAITGERREMMLLSAYDVHGNMPGTMMFFSHLLLTTIILGRY